ncbi:MULTISPECIES: hypothetical protein [Pseudomonas]|jgi:hypothetical protein|uniref:hypothetical protein n=1 Tax=Pseudomonas TaxID=286 RepID=UPI00236203D7|nr:hypothetical protein [Pseudomonas sp. TNT2022 ID642]MDD1003608.1 hypothetical protein [Pseudomonas sp. TNT2022 ID642]
METLILKVYSAELAERAKHDGIAPRAITVEDERIAALAAAFPERDLRHAVVMRAAYERQLTTELRKQKDALPAPASEA